MQSYPENSFELYNSHNKDIIFFLLSNEVFVTNRERISGSIFSIDVSISKELISLSFNCFAAMLSYFKRYLSNRSSQLVLTIVDKLFLFNIESKLFSLKTSNTEKIENCGQYL
ncbi:hypothetical protein ACUNFP_02720, partial [Serratia sp. IR-2025]